MTTHTMPVEPRYAETASAALAFDPPATYGDRPVSLPRGIREPSAYVGYQDVTATYFDVQTDDDQYYQFGDSSYERRAMMDRVGVTYR